MPGKLVDRYLDVVSAHEPAKAPIAKGAKFTENGQKLALGDWLLDTMSGKGTYHLFVNGRGGAGHLLRMHQKKPIPAVIAVRLKIQNRQIAEIEQFIQRSA